MLCTTMGMGANHAPLAFSVAEGEGSVIGSHVRLTLQPGLLSAVQGDAWGAWRCTMPN